MHVELWFTWIPNPHLDRVHRNRVGNPRFRWVLGIEAAPAQEQKFRPELRSARS